MPKPAPASKNANTKIILTVESFIPILDPNQPETPKIIIF